MAEIGAFEAKTHFSKLLERASNGEEFTITRRGKAVARLVPVRRIHDPKKARAALERINSRAQENPGPPVTVDEIKSWINEGRR